MNLCDCQRLDSCNQFKVIHVVAEIVSCQFLIAAVLQAVDNVTLLIIGQALGNGLE